MMSDNKALQNGTSHNLGQNFAKQFELKFASETGARSSPGTRRGGEHAHGRRARDDAQRRPGRGDAAARGAHPGRGRADLPEAEEGRGGAGKAREIAAALAPAACTWTRART
jgi:hypothetical protein